MKERIFVYGTLRKGMYNYDHYLRDENSFRSYGYIKGSLMTLQGVVYPAYLKEGQDMILGEIHEVSEETLKAIDEMEGYYGENHQENEYNKEICDIYDDHQQIIEQLPVYVYNMDKPQNVKSLGVDIETHDYVQFIQKRKVNNKKSVFYFGDDDEDEDEDDIF